MVNRDIKLENTLLDGSKRPLLKICDFGYSKNDKDSVPKSKVGTPGYTGGPAVGAAGLQGYSFFQRWMTSSKGRQAIGPMFRS